jgi:hypothetical protein
VQLGTAGVHDDMLADDDGVAGERAGLFLGHGNESGHCLG